MVDVEAVIFVRKCPVLYLGLMKRMDILNDKCTIFDDKLLEKLES